MSEPLPPTGLRSLLSRLDRAVDAVPLSQRVFALIGFALGVAFLGQWFTLFSTTDNPEVWQRDWYQLWLAGHRFDTGAWTELYSREFTEGAFWLYPPYALYLVAPLGLLPPVVAYGVVIGIEGLAFAACLALLVRGGLDRAPLPLATSTFGSAAFVSVIVMGQSSALLALSLLGGAYLLDRDRPWLAGVAFAALGVKPNWVICVVGVLLVARHFRTVAAMAACGAAMLLSSIPLGTQLWSDFFFSTRGVSELLLERYEVWKLITVHASLRTLLPTGAQGWLTPVWLGIVAVLGLALLVVAWRRRADPWHLAGVSVLFTISANLYTNFYDAFVLLVPVAVWWNRPQAYPRAAWAGIGLLAGFVWAWQWGSLYGWRGDLSLAPVGAAVALWLLIEAGAALWRDP